MLIIFLGIFLVWGLERARPTWLTQHVHWFQWPPGLRNRKNSLEKYIKDRVVSETFSGVGCRETARNEDLGEAEAAAHGGHQDRRAAALENERHGGDTPLLSFTWSSVCRSVDLGSHIVENYQNLIWLILSVWLRPSAAPRYQIWISKVNKLQRRVNLKEIIIRLQAISFEVSERRTFLKCFRQSFRHRNKNMLIKSTWIFLAQTAVLKFQKIHRFLVALMVWGYRGVLSRTTSVVNLTTQ